MRKRTKKQRQKWWRNLSDEERDAYIKSVQKRKEINKQNQPPRESAVIEVTPETKNAWLQKIYRKNPWLNKDSDEQGNKIHSRI